MLIQREWHNIDRQSGQGLSSVDQMLPPVLSSSSIAPIIVQVLTTLEKTRLHITTCHFHSAVVINAYLTISVAFVFNQSLPGLVQDSKL